MFFFIGRAFFYWTHNFLRKKSERKMFLFCGCAMILAIGSFFCSVCFCNFQMLAWMLTFEKIFHCSCFELQIVFETVRLRFFQYLNSDQFVYYPCNKQRYSNPVLDFFPINNFVQDLSGRLDSSLPCFIMYSIFLRFLANLAFEFESDQDLFLNEKHSVSNEIFG